MEKLLAGLIGRQVDVGLGTSGVFRGEVAAVADGVVHLKDDEANMTFIALDKISSVRERSDSHSRPGFIA